MPRENAQDKGRRYATEGRLRVLHVGRWISATCRGQGATYALGWQPGRGWYCACPARTRCSHLVALQLVTDEPKDDR